MPDPLIEELALDLTPALQGLDPLNEALAQISANFGLSFADTISQTVASLQLPEIDVAPLATAVQTALDEGAATPVVVDADVTPLAAAVADVVSQPETVEVGADTAGAKDAIDALSGEPVTVEVDADVSAAQDQFDQLGTTVHSAHGEVAGFEGAVVGARVASGLAAGEVGAFGEAAHVAGGSAVAAVAGISALASFIGETVKVAADAEAQTKRFAAAFGPLREQVEHINIGGLNITIDELGKRSGTTLANLDAVASRIAALGRSSGATDEQLVGTTQKLLALAGQISVTNPRLGDAAEVADRLTNAFVRGGRALAPFGIALTAGQIAAQAFSDTGKENAKDLTIFEKATAGAELQVAKLGGTLGTAFDAGARNAQVQLRAIKVQLEETLVGIGAPLLAPVVQLSKAVVPLAAGIGGVLGSAVGAALPLIVPVVTELSRLVTVIGGPLSTALASLGPSLANAGVAFGDILVSLSPVVTLLASALIPAAQVLTPLLDGTAAVLQLVADVLGIIPAPLLDVAVGLGILTLAWRNWLFVAGTTSEVIDLALGPVGLVLLALTAVGVGLNLFGSHAQKSKIDASALGDAIFGTAHSADELDQKLIGLNSSLAEYEKKQLAATDKGKNGLAALGQLGKGYDDVAKAVGGTDEQLASFIADLEIEADLHLAVAKARGGDVDAANAQVRAVAGLADVLNEQRDALKLSAQAQVVALVATKQLTQAQLDAIEKRHIDQFGLGDWITVLKEATAVVDKHVAAQRAERDATGQTADAFAQLRQEVIAGTTTTDNFDKAATRLGLTSKETETFVKDLTDALTKFVSEGLSKLPNALAPIENFQHRIETGLSDAASATTSGAKSVDSAQKRLVEATGSNAADLAIAQQKLAAASALDPSDATTKAIESAQKNVQTVIEQGGKNLGNARQQVADAQRAGAVDLAKARAELLAATDPEQVVRQTFEEAAAIVSFQANIQTLLAAGLTNVARTLISEGPTTGAVLAQSLVDQPAVAKQLNDVQGLLTTATHGYQTFLEGQAPELAGAAAVAGTAVSDGFNTNVHLDASGPINAFVAQFIAGRSKTSEAASAAALAAQVAHTEGFDLHSPVKKEADAAAAAIEKSPVVSAARTAGSASAAAFGDAFNPAIPITAAFGKIELLLLEQTSTISAPLARAGDTFGQQIGSAISGGVVKGITSGFPDVGTAGGQLIGAATTGAKSAGKIKSPSELFADLGRQLVAGLALGLSEHGPASAASGRLVAATTTPFADLSLPRGFSAAGPAPAAATVPVAPALAAATTSPSVVVQGPLVGTVHNEQTAMQVAAELAWTYSP